MVHFQVKRGDDKELMLRPMLRIPKSQPATVTNLHRSISALHMMRLTMITLSCRYVTNERASFPASSRAKAAVNEGLMRVYRRTSARPEDIPH